MAKSPVRPGRGAAARASAKSRRPSGDAEAVQDAPGMPFEVGVAILTTVCLVAAILLIDALKGHFDGGLFFGG